MVENSELKHAMQGILEHLDLSSSDKISLARVRYTPESSPAFAQVRRRAIATTTGTDTAASLEAEARAEATLVQ